MRGAKRPTRPEEADLMDWGVISRRQFVKRLGCAAAALAVPGIGAEMAIERHRLKIERKRIPVPGLPVGFSGFTVALLADLHHGPWNPLGYLRQAIALTNTLGAEVVLLGGDYVRKGSEYIGPIWRELAALDAPRGVHAVLGNHDQWDDESLVFTRQCMRDAGITDLTNRGVSLSRGAEVLHIAGVGDLWTDGQDLDRALANVPNDGCAVLLSHNPDYIEEMDDVRVKLVLSGHTHGGQINLPLIGTPIVPSKYGNRYARGLIRRGWKQVYVTRGVGLSVLPIRFRCRPEISLLTLEAG